MENEIKNVRLSFACQENWNTMEPVNGGKFCDSCKHVVYDFTNQSDCELKKILSENKRVCGRFKRSQMNASFLKYAAATTIVASGMAINSCMDEEIKPNFPAESEIPGILPDEVKLDTSGKMFYTTGLVVIDPTELKTDSTTADEIHLGEVAGEATSE
jgi:hypothetical protein